MKGALLLVLIGLVLSPARSFAHRLDEYLQATILSVDAAHVEGTIRLVPGVAVASAVIDSIGSPAGESFAPAAQQVYARAVISDLRLQVDGKALPLRLVSTRFPSIDALRQGVGEIELTFQADWPAGVIPHALTYENQHQPDRSVYLVNATVPRDPAIRIEHQVRNESQSTYRIDLTPPWSAARMPGSGAGGFVAAFRLGVQHIAAGTDHLMFLLALLLPAPLLAGRRRWEGSAGLRRSLLQSVGIVTAFTVGHSLSLISAASVLVHAPSQWVETLIALSILISALHALRPLFPGREAVVAGCFGLIHGLAFAEALSELGLSGSYLWTSVLGFNLGIEAMQLVVVGAVLPSLLLLSRAPIYTLLRPAGAAFIGVAALGWIGERAFQWPNPVTPLVEQLTRHALWLVVALYGGCLTGWIWRRGPAALRLASG